MVEPLYSSEESTIFYDFSVKDRILAQYRNLVPINIKVENQIFVEL